jgi:hypothetical protein
MNVEVRTCDGLLAPYTLTTAAASGIATTIIALNVYLLYHGFFG